MTDQIIAMVDYQAYFKESGPTYQIWKDDTKDTLKFYKNGDLKLCCSIAMLFRILEDRQ